MNQAINFFWTMLCFMPVAICWYLADSMALCYWLIALSLLCMLMPARLLQLSDNPAFYIQTGVRFFRKFVQNGDYVNRFTMKHKPGFRVVKSKESATQYIKTAAMFQAYHFGCLVFFTLTTVYAVMETRYLLAAAIALANIAYNVYPMLLQQYNRARISKITKH